MVVALIHKVLNPLFAMLFYPFSRTDPLWGLLAVSVLTSVLALLVYRYFSSQTQIGRVKDLLKAHILEMRLFQQDPFLMGRAVRSALRANLSYLRLNLKPFLVMFIPVVLILVQLEARFGYRPLRPGEPVLVRSFWQTAAPLQDQDLEQRVQGEGVSFDSPPLRIGEKREIDWKVRVNGSGPASLSLWNGQERVSIPLRVSDQLVPVSSWNGRKGDSKRFFYPAAETLPDRGDLVAVEVDYPARNLTFWGAPVHWIWPFSVFTLIAGYLLKGFFKVQL